MHELGDRPPRQGAAAAGRAQCLRRLLAADARNRQLAWSDQLARLHGAEPGYQPGYEDALTHFVPRSTAPSSRRACAPVAGAGVPFDIEVQVRTLQGLLWVRCVGQLLRAEGQIVGAEGLVQEIAPAGLRAGTLLRHTVSMAGAEGSGEASSPSTGRAASAMRTSRRSKLLAAAGEPLRGTQDLELLPEVRAWRWKSASCRRWTARGHRAGGDDAQGSHWLELRGFPFGAGLALHLRDVSARRRAAAPDAAGRQHRPPQRHRHHHGSRAVPRARAAHRVRQRGLRAPDRLAPRRGDRPVAALPAGPDTQRAQLDRIRGALEQERARVDLVNYTRGPALLGGPGRVAGLGRARRLTHWVAVGATSPSASATRRRSSTLRSTTPHPVAQPPDAAGPPGAGGGRGGTRATAP